MLPLLVSLQSGVTQGDDETPAVTYRDAGPNFFTSQDKAITRKGHSSVPLSFPGVIDSVSIPPYSYAPNQHEYRNVIRTSLLMNNDNDLPTSRQWNEFREYMREHGLFSVEYEQYDPTPIPFNIKADIFVNSDAPDTPTIENRVRRSLNNLFKKGSGSLGLGIFQSDINNAIATATEGINYVELKNPTQNYKLDYSDLEATFEPINHRMNYDALDLNDNNGDGATGTGF